jgi:hypothetical protein
MKKHDMSVLTLQRLINKFDKNAVKSKNSIHVILPNTQKGRATINAKPGYNIIFYARLADTFKDPHSFFRTFSQHLAADIQGPGAS